MPRFSLSPIRTGLRTVRRGWRVPAAAIWRRFLNPEHVVAVTGSCGKSTTAALIGEIFSRCGPTRIGVGTNTRSAVVRTILRARRSHRFWVQEVSGHQPGAIAKSARLLKHSVAVVTTIGSDHRKSFGSVQAIADEKGRLVSGLPADGLAVLNADDSLVRAMRDRTNARVVTFGKNGSADIRLVSHSAGFPSRLQLTVTDGDETVEIRTRLVGLRWLDAVLAAVACGRALGVSLGECAKAVEAVEPRHGRDSVHEILDGPTIVLDTVKAPFWTIPSSIETVRTTRSPRRTIVFGTISDYTGSSSKKYRDVAREALVAADRVLFVGQNSGRVAKLERENPERLVTFPTARRARDFLRQTVVPGELIYIKSSGIDHLERLLYDWQAPILCWADDCRKSFSCDACKRLYGERRTKPGLVNAAARRANSDTAS